MKLRRVNKTALVLYVMRKCANRGKENESLMDDVQERDVALFTVNVHLASQHGRYGREVFR